MNAAAIGARLEELVLPGHLADGEIEECAELLAPLSDSAQRRVLDLVASLWPVSHALTFSFLRHAHLGLAVFGETRLQVWVGAILDAYEAGGLEQARSIVADGGQALVRELRGEGGVRYRDVVGLLHPYLRALAGGAIDVAEGREAATDTAVVWLPTRIAVFEDSSRNFLLYKLAAALQWGHIASGTYRAELPPGHPLLAGLERRFGTSWGGRPAWLVNFFGLFPDPELASGSTTRQRRCGRPGGSPETCRGSLGRRRRCSGAYFAFRHDPGIPGGRERLFESLRRWIWNLPGAVEETDPDVLALLAPLRQPGATAAEAVLAVAGIYPLAAALPAGGAVADTPPFEGGCGRRSPKSAAGPGGSRRARSSSRPFEP